MIRRPAVLAATAAAAGVAGVCVSVYLTIVHYSALPLVCSTSGAIDCGRVLSSGYALIAGTAVPTSVAGIAWFAISTVLGALEVAGASRAIVRAHLAWAAIGLATILYLLFVEIVQLGAICAWCTAAHVLVLVTFLVTLVLWQNTSERSPSP